MTIYRVQRLYSKGSRQVAEEARLRTESDYTEPLKTEYRIKRVCDDLGDGIFGAGLGLGSSVLSDAILNKKTHHPLRNSVIGGALGVSASEINRYIKRKEEKAEK